MYKFIVLLLGSIFWLHGEKTLSKEAIKEKSIRIDVDNLLKQGVKDGLIDYALFKKNKQVIYAYTTILSSNLSKEERNTEAFVDWINLYNLLTIDLIVNNYPGLKSIKNLERPWDTTVVTIRNVALTLNDIEHKKLRGLFKDYRVHFVLVCASLGCPDLRPSLYTYQGIEKELEEETQKYLNSSKGTQLKTGYMFGDYLSISRLFKWYKDDFVPSVQEVLKKHLIEREKIKVLNRSYDYIPYSWDLNDLNPSVNKRGKSK